MSKTHELKTDAEHFENVWAGCKTFENRLDDREYAVGDKLILNEQVEVKSATGRTIEAEIIYMTDFGMQTGYKSLALHVTQKNSLGARTICNLIAQVKTCLSVKGTYAHQLEVELKNILQSHGWGTHKWTKSKLLDEIRQQLSTRSGGAHIFALKLRNALEDFGTEVHSWSSPSKARPTTEYAETQRKAKLYDELMLAVHEFGYIHLTKDVGNFDESKSCRFTMGSAEAFADRVYSGANVSEALKKLWDGEGYHNDDELDLKPRPDPSDDDDEIVDIDEGDLD